jgi:hypothetical protein
MGSRSLFRRTAFCATLTAAAATAAILTPTGVAGAASPVPEWATDGLSMIHPGVVTITKNQSCTSNFIFLDGDNNAYLGQAAHCSGTGSATETNGCDSKSLPIGTPVTLGASGAKGKLVYNSWLAMQEAGERDKAACANNDFALISIPRSAMDKVSPTVPVFGGPMGIRTSDLNPGEAVLSYGNSPLRGGLSVLSPKQGVSLGSEGNGWGHQVYTATPGVPGDSGSGFFDAKGMAFGVLSTLSLAPVPGSNGVADLAKCLAYAQKHSGIKGLQLAKGTKDFTPSLLPVVGALLPGGAPAPLSSR